MFVTGQGALSAPRQGIRQGIRRLSTALTNSQGLLQSNREYEKSHLFFDRNLHE